MIPLPLSNPPRHAVRLMKLVQEALTAHEIVDPALHVAILRSMQEGLIVLSGKPLEAEDIKSTREFAGKWGFDLVALPGMERDEANRYHLLESPVFHNASQVIFSGQGRLPVEADWYLSDPPDDVRPYFWRSMQWSHLPELLRKFGRQGLIWLDWSLLMTLAKLVLASVLAAVFIIAPLGRLPRVHRPSGRRETFVYFSMLGLGFLLLEMAAFQRSMLYLGHPVTTAALVFSVFLVGAGIGSFSTPSGCSSRLVRGIFLPVIAGGAFAFICLFHGSEILFRLPTWVRIIAVALFLFPLSWSMGRAMPWGLRQLDAVRPLIPWAWGINGLASVLAAPVATLLSVHFSQPATWLVGLLCYLAAWASAGKLG